MNRNQQINKIVEALADSPTVESIDGFEEVTYHFDCADDCVATPELLDKFRLKLFEKIANMVIFNKKSDILSGMDGKWDAARLERGFTFGGGDPRKKTAIDLIPLYPEANYKYKMLCWVR